MSLGDQIIKFSPGNSPILSIDCSLDSKTLVIGQISGNEGVSTLSLWNLQDFSLIKTIKKSRNGQHSVHRVVYNADSTKLVFILQDGEFFFLVVYNLKNDEEKTLKKVRHIQEIMGYSIDPKSDELVLAVEDNEIEVWDLENSKLVRKISVYEKFKPLSADASLISSISPNSQYLAIGGFKEGSITIYDKTTYRSIQELTAPFGFPSQIVFDSEFKNIIVVDFWNNGTFIWEINSGERYLANVFNEHILNSSCAAILQNKKYAVLGYTSAYLSVLDFTSGEELFDDKLHEARIFDIKVTPDCKRIISAGEDWQIIVRSIE